MAGPQSALRQETRQPIAAGVDLAESERAPLEFERDLIPPADKRKIEELRQVHDGSSLPVVSSAHGSRSIPSRKATEVHATGVTIVCMRATPAPTRNVMPA